MAVASGLAVMGNAGMNDDFEDDVEFNPHKER